MRDDESEEGLIEHLRLTVMGKLSIDNPNYESYKRLKQKNTKP